MTKRKNVISHLVAIAICTVLIAASLFVPAKAHDAILIPALFLGIVVLWETLWSLVIKPNEKIVYYVD